MKTNTTANAAKYMLAPTFGVLVTLLITFFISTLSAQESLLVRKTQFEGAKVEIMASNLNEAYRFQRSFDARNWDDIFVMVPDFNGVNFPDPTSSQEQKAFYRLKRFSDDAIATASINLDPTDRHLLSYKRGSEMELHLFGTRDEVGLPHRVENYVFRVGNKTYSGGVPLLSVAPSAASKNALQADEASDFTWTDDDFRHLTGYVFVERNEECPQSSSPPVVQWRVTQKAPGYEGDPVFGQKQAIPAPEYGEVEGYDVFSYTIPWFSNGYQVPAPVDIKQFAKDITDMWAEEIVRDILFGDVGEEVALSGLEHLAERAGSGGINPLVKSGLALMSIYVATLNAETAAENYDHGTETFGAFEALEMEIRAVIPESNAGTPWDTISSPVLLAQGPDLIIDSVPCDGVVAPAIGDISIHSVINHHSFQAPLREQDSDGRSFEDSAIGTTPFTHSFENDAEDRFGTDYGHFLGFGQFDGGLSDSMLTLRVQIYTEAERPPSGTNATSGDFIVWFTVYEPTSISLNVPSVGTPTQWRGASDVSLRTTGSNGQTIYYGSDPFSQQFPFTVVLQPDRYRLTMNSSSVVNSEDTHLPRNQSSRLGVTLKFSSPQ